MVGTGPDTRAPDPSDPHWDQPGGLGVKERRSWATWQLLAAAVVAVFVGMAIGHTGSSASGGGSEAGGGGFTTTTRPGGEGGATTTTAAGGATTTTRAASGGPTTTAPAGAATTTTVAVSGTPSVLVPNTNGTGPQTLPSFTVAGGEWQLGWAYRCVLAPGGAGPFKVLVVPEAGPAPTAPAVDEQGRDGAGEASLTSAGRQRLEVQTDPACQWAVKVVGVAG